MRVLFVALTILERWYTQPTRSARYSSINRSQNQVNPRKVEIMFTRRQPFLQCLSIVTHPGRLARLLVVVGLTAGLALVALPRTALASTDTVFPGPEATYVVPAGVTSINVTANGGYGSDNCDANSFGGYGSSVTATIPVTPGETLYIDVGSAGAVPTGGTSGTTPSGWGQWWNP